MKNSVSSKNVSTRLRALWVPLVASCLAATSCSLPKLGYENLPMLAMWRVDSYIPLNAEQRALASRRIEGLHHWHRSTQLDDYIVFLQGVQAHIATRPVTEADIQGWRADVLQRWKPIAERAAPAVAEVAVTLDAEQLGKMRAELTRANEKLRREWMPPSRADRVEARTKRYLERAELFLGSLTDSQKRLARRMAAEAPPTEDQWYAQRVGRQQETLALMERIRVERPNDAVAATWMRDLMLRWSQLRDRSDRVGAESSLASGDAMSAALLAEATPRQREHVNRKLQEWIDLLQSLKPAQVATRKEGEPRVADRAAARVTQP